MNELAYTYHPGNDEYGIWHLPLWLWGFQTHCRHSVVHFVNVLKHLLDIKKTAETLAVVIAKNNLTLNINILITAKLNTDFHQSSKVTTPTSYLPNP